MTITLRDTGEVKWKNIFLNRRKNTFILIKAWDNLLRADLDNIFGDKTKSKGGWHMQCFTRDFGEIEIQETDILHFTQPPFGFEQFQQYIILFDDEMDNGFAWMQSIDDSELCFILLDAEYFAPSYAPVMPDNMADTLGGNNISTWVICVVPTDAHRATANLKSPVYINLDTKKGTQIILQQEYPVRQPLIEQEA